MKRKFLFNKIWTKLVPTSKITSKTFLKNYKNKK